MSPDGGSFRYCKRSPYARHVLVDLVSVVRVLDSFRALKLEQWTWAVPHGGNRRIS